MIRSENLKIDYIKIMYITYKLDNPYIMNFTMEYLPLSPFIDSVRGIKSKVSITLIKNFQNTMNLKKINESDFIGILKNSVTNITNKYSSRKIHIAFSIDSEKINDFKIMGNYAKYIAAFLEENKHITTLSLGILGVKNTGVILDKSHNLQIIKTCIEKLSNDDISALCDLLEKSKTIQRLYLFGYKLLDDSEDDSEMDSEDDSEDDIYSLDVNKLDPTMVRLELSKGLGKSLVTSNLLLLDLSFCYIGDDGMKYLAEGLKQNNKLIHLNLTHNNLTSVGIEYLCNSLIHSSEYIPSNNFTELILSYNKLDSNCCKYIGNLLKYSKTIRCLDISNCNIDNEGIKYISMGLDSVNWSQHLDLSYNYIFSNGLMYMLKTLYKPVSVEIDYKSIKKDYSNIYLNRYIYDTTPITLLEISDPYKPNEKIVNLNFDDINQTNYEMTQCLIHTNIDY